LGKEKSIDWGGADCFGSLYRIKGRRGLFNKRKQIHRHDMVPMVMFGEPSQTCVVPVGSLVQLSSYIFVTYAGHKDLKMQDVFHNLNEYFKTTNGIPKIYDLMQIMVPEFDEDKFLESHAQMVFDWYIQWIGVVSKIFGEHEKQN